MTSHYLNHWWPSFLLRHHRNLPLKKSPCISRMELIFDTQLSLISSDGVWTISFNSDPGVLSINVKLNGSSPLSTKLILLTCKENTISFHFLSHYDWYWIDIWTSSSKMHDSRQNHIYILMPVQNGCHLAHNIFKYIFWTQNIFLRNKSVLFWYRFKDLS